MGKQKTKFKETEIGEIPEDWGLKELIEVCNIEMGQSPPSTSYNSEGEGTLFLQGIRTFGAKYPSFDTWTTDPKKIAKKGDVLFSVRAPVGEVNITKEQICIGRGLSALSMKNNNNEFLYYLLTHLKNRILGRQTGTVYGSINKDIIKKLKLPFPHENEQKAIAKILSDLDSKIELLQNQNETLEEIGKAIFKQWFVDFEFPNENSKPYKSSGGKMVESEMGEIPRDWEVNKIEGVADVIGGGTPSTKVESYFCKKGIPWLSPRDLSGFKGKFIQRGERDITEQGLKNSSAKLMPKGTVLFSSRAPIGYCVIAENGISTNQGFKSFVPKKNINSEFLFQWLKINKKEIENHAHGSTFKEVSGSTLKSFKLVVPTIELIKIHSSITYPMNERIRFNQHEIVSLQKTRDLLLPKLMSGKIRVGVKL